ncbi:hypothetical protein N9B20_04195, partial [Mariniblastus sp.]|nr:hypothetical protein [Mariniblastus sp.]
MRYFRVLPTACPHLGNAQARSTAASVFPTAIARPAPYSSRAKNRSQKATTGQALDKASGR